MEGSRMSEQTLTVSDLLSVIRDAEQGGRDQERATITEHLARMRKSAISSGADPIFVAGLTAAFEGISRAGVTPNYLESDQ